MFSPGVPSSTKRVTPGPAAAHPAWRMANPNVDRSAPPPAKKKKRAKKKAGKKR